MKMNLLRDIFNIKRSCFINLLALVVVILFSRSVRVVASLDNEKKPTNERFEDLISEILIREAPINDFIIHYDSTSGEFIDGIILKTNAKKIKPNNVIFTANASYPATTVIINYDKLHERKSNNCKRRFSIHVISLKNPLEFDIYFLDLLKPNDIIIFICQIYYGTCKGAFDRGSDINALDPFFLNKSKFLDRVLLTVVIEVLGYRVRLYEICYYCGTTAGVLIKKHEIDLTTGISFNDINLYSNLMEIFKFKTWNFNSHVFKVGFPYNNINFLCRNPKETRTYKSDEFEVSCDSIHGLEGMMLMEVQRRLNLKVQLLSFRSNETFEVTDKMINMTRDRRADWSVGSISVTAERTEKVFFSFPVFEDPIKALYSAKGGFLKDGFRIFHVFSGYIWLLIVFTLIVQAAVVYIWNRNAGQNKKKLSDIVWALGLMLTEQPLQINWKSFGGRVSVSWILCCICLSTLLKAHLTSFITKPPKIPSVKLDELVGGGYHLNLVREQSGLIWEMLNTSTDKSLQELSHRVATRTDMCSTLQYIIGNKELVFEELNLVFYELNLSCRTYLTSEDLLSLLMAGDNVFPLKHAWAFPMKAPYINFIHQQIMLYHQHGLQKKWSEHLRVPPGNLSVYFDGVSVVDRNRGPKRIKGFTHFVVWFFGIGLSSLCFITEIVFKGYQNRKISGKGTQLTFEEIFSSQ